jgi:hypothetical protein
MTYMRAEPMRVSARPQRREITRRSDEPNIEIGQPIEDHGEQWIVVARYTPADASNQVRYVLERP